MDKRKVLFVDDVELFVQLEKTFFSRDEFTLLAARNGREALSIVREEKPNLVFLDLHMPEMDGDDCCRIIKSHADYSSIPINMVTQGGCEEDLERCRKAGCDDIVLKPINRGQIVATAHRFLSVQDQRYLAHLRVQYGPGPGRLLSNYTVNLSTGGLFLETDVPLPEGVGDRCPKSGDELRLRMGKNGLFVACAGYPDCDFTVDIPDDKIADLRSYS